MGKQRDISGAPPEEVARQERIDSFIESFKTVDTGPINTDLATVLPDGPSKYDEGWTPSKGPIEKWRAQNQPWHHQFARRAVRSVVNIPLLTGQLVGHILDTPENIKGLVDGEDFQGNKNDFDNVISKGFKDVYDQWNALLPVHRENPDKVFDFGDPAFWFNAGFDTVDWAGSFIAAGAGTGKALQGLSRGAQAIGRGENLIGKALAFSENLQKGAAVGADFAVKGLNTGLMSEAIGALNASQSFQDIYQYALEQKNPNTGQNYTEDEALVLASNEAADVFKWTTLFSSVLNVSSTAPFLSTGSRIGGKLPSGQMGTREYINALKGMRAKEGQKTLNWMNRLGFESAQEGTEEVMEGVNQQLAMASARGKMGKSEDFDMFSEENALAFSLGALAGGGIGGASHIKQARDHRKSQDEFGQMVQDQIDVLERNEELIGEIQQLQSIRTEDVSAAEYVDNTVDIAKAETELLANGMAHGIWDNTAMVMSEMMNEAVSKKDEEAADQQINKERAEIIRDTILRNREIMRSTAASPIPIQSQKHALLQSTRNDLYTARANEVGEEIKSTLSAYKKEQDKYVAVNKLRALESMGDTLTDVQAAEKEQLTELVGEIVSPSQFNNDALLKSYTTQYALQYEADQAELSYARLMNGNTSIEESNKLDKEMETRSKKAERVVDRNNHLEHYDNIIANSEHEGDIRQALDNQRQLLNNRSLADWEKKALQERIKTSERLAEARIQKLKQQNIRNSNVSNAEEGVTAAAQALVDNDGNTDAISEEDRSAFDSNPIATEQLAEQLRDSQEEGSKNDYDDVANQPNEGEEDTTSPNENESPEADITDGLKAPADQSTPSAMKIENELDVKDDDNPEVKPHVNVVSETEMGPLPGEVTQFDQATDDEARIFFKRFDGSDYTLDGAKKKIKRLEEDSQPGKFQQRELSILKEEVRAFEAGEKRSIFLPKLTEDANGNVVPAEATMFLPGQDPELMTEIFQSIDGIPAIELLQEGEELEVRAEPDFKYNITKPDPKKYPYGTTPLNIYKKGQDKPLAQVPFVKKFMNPMATAIRRRFIDDSTPMRVQVSFKSTGDFIKSYTDDGSIVQHPITALTGPGNPNVILGLNYDGRTVVPNYADSTFAQDPAVKKGLEQIHNVPVATSRKGNAVNPDGQQFGLVLGPNGRYVPAYIKSRTLRDGDVTELMNQLGDILAQPDGVKELRKLVSVKHKSIYSDGYTGQVVSAFLKSGGKDRGTGKDLKLFTVPRGLVFWSKSKNGWVAIDHKSLKKGDRNWLKSFLDGGEFYYRVFDGETTYLRQGGRYFNNDLSTPELSEEHTALRDELREILSNSHYNISRDFANSSQPFNDIWGMGHANYNQYVVDNDMYTTDVVPDARKFEGSSIRITPISENLSTADPLTGEPVTTEKEIATAEKEAKKYEAREEKNNQEKEVPKPTVANPVADRVSENFNYEKAGDDILDQLDPTKLRRFGKANGYARMAPAEINWMKKHVGADNITLIKGVDRVLAVGGRQAFGYYHNGMVTLAEMAETGTAYHEAFHFVFNTSMNEAQRHDIFKEAAKIYPYAQGRIELEEALAEDFRAYMLEKDKKKRPSKIAEFFKGILAYIEKILGKNVNRNANNQTNDIEALFEDIYGGKLTRKHREYFGRELESSPKTRLISPELTSWQQNQGITDASSKLIAKVAEISSPDQTLGDIISSPERLNGIIGDIKNEYISAVNALEANDLKGKTMLARAGKASPEAIRQIQQAAFMKRILRNWTLEDVRGSFPKAVTSFELELKKSLGRFGFEVVTEFVPEGETDPNNPQVALAETDNEQNHIYNRDVTLKDTKKTISNQLRRKLSLLPVYESNEDGSIKMEDDAPVVKRTLLGTPMIHDFNKVYSNVKSQMADLPMDAMLTRIQTRATDSPIFGALWENMKESFQKDKSNESRRRVDGFVADFFSAFNNASYPLVTITPAGYGKYNPRVIMANRKNIKRQISRSWEENAMSKGLLDANYNPDTSKWSQLYDSYKGALETLGRPPQGSSAKRIWNDQAAAILKKYSDTIGMDLNEGVYQTIRNRAGEIPKSTNGYYDALQGKTRLSLEHIIDRGAQGLNPYGNQRANNIFAGPQARYVNDLNAGSVMANGKQFQEIGMPSFITDFMNQVKLESANKAPNTLDQFLEDPFYKGNEFINYLKSDGQKAEFIQFLDYRENNSKGAEYIETTFAQSFMQKFIAYDGLDGDHGYYSLGTLSDKTKNVGMRLPRSKSYADAEENYVKVMLNTAFQESSRIERVKANPNYAAKFRDGSKFHYVPLNDIWNDHVSDGGTSAADFDKKFNERIRETIIATREMNIEMMHRTLETQGLLIRGDNGEFHPHSWRLKRPLGMENSTDEEVMDRLNKFLLDDTIWKMEMSKVLMGDLAKYKGFEDYFKRMYQLTTPGRKVFVDSQMNNASSKQDHHRLIIKSPRQYYNLDDMATISEYILKDEKKAAKAKRHLEAMMEKEPKSELVGENDRRAVNEGSKLGQARVDKFIKDITKKDGQQVANAVYVAYSYRSNNRADAASFSSIEFFRDQMKGLGSWNSDYEWIYQNAWSKAITVQEATAGMDESRSKYFQDKESQMTASILKPFYYGIRQDEVADEAGNRIPYMVHEQFKESIAPILPIWGDNISGFSWMLDRFKKDNIDIIATDDTVKVGLAEDTYQLGDTQVVARKLPASNLRYPQVPARFKEETRYGTQVEKITMSNLSAEGQYSLPGSKVSGVELSNTFHDAHRRLTARAYRNLLGDLGIKSVASIPYLKGQEKTDFLIKLKEKAEKFASTRDVSDNFLDVLDLTDDGQDFKVGMDMDVFARNYQNLVFSLFNDALLRQKTPGGAMVNMADVSSIEEDENLKFIRVEGGKIQAAQVAMPYAFGKQLGVGWGIQIDGKDTVDVAGKVIWENIPEERHKEIKHALRAVLYRIPTQMKSSTLPVEIHRILPPSDGAKIMLPAELTTQGGIDYDFDKSFFMLPNVGEANMPSGTELKGLNRKQLENMLFEIHWSVMTNPAHFEEMVTPISSRTHDAILTEQLGNLDSGMDKTNVFNPVSNIEMEGLAKYSHIMRGTFSKFAGGHNVLNNLAKVADINEYVNLTTPVEIKMSNGYQFNELGRDRDAAGFYISENHSENLNSALDSQKDPRLGRLNISTFNSQAVGYMTNLGVPQRVVVNFMNQPIMKEVAKNYFLLGGTPRYLTKAIRTTAFQNGVEAEYDRARKQHKNRPVTISEQDLEKYAFQQDDSSPDQFKAQILVDFQRYQAAGRDMARANSALSPDTQDKYIVDAASAKLWLQDLEYVQEEPARNVPGSSPAVHLNPSLFDSKVSPLKRVSAYTEYGLHGAIEFMDEFFPYNNDFYTNTIQEIMETQNYQSRDWAFFDNLQSTIGLASAASARIRKEGEVVQDDIIDVISKDADGKDFRERYSLYKGDELPTIVDEYRRLAGKYPKLEANQFFSKLQPDRQNISRATQILSFPATSDNYEQSEAVVHFQELLNQEGEVGQFAKDLVAYSVMTSGFSKSSHGFVAMVPAAFWYESGAADLLKQAKKKSNYDTSGSGSTLLEQTGAFPQLGYTDTIIKHLAYTELVPTLGQENIEGEKGRGTWRTLDPDGVLYVSRWDKAVKQADEENPTRYVKKMWNGEWTLFKHVGSTSMSLEGDTQDKWSGYIYVRTDTLGEGQWSNEFFQHGSESDAYRSKVPQLNKKGEVVLQDTTPSEAELAERASVYTTSEALDQEAIKYRLVDQSPVIKAADIELGKKLDTFLAANKIDTHIVNSLEEKFGLSAIGAADAFNKAIYLARGHELGEAKTEEVAHIYIESTLNNKATRDMIQQARVHPQYHEYYREYRDVYNGDEDAIAREVAAKILSEYLAKHDTYKDRSALQRAISKFMDMIRRVFGKLDPFKFSASEILRGVQMDGMTANTGVMFQLNNDNSTPKGQNYTGSDVDVLPSLDENIAPEEYQDSSLTEDEKARVDSLANRANIKTVKDLLDRMRVKVRKRISRARNNPDKQREAYELWNHLDEVTDTEGVIAILEDADQRLSRLDSNYQYAKEEGTLDLNKLKYYADQLQAFQSTANDVLMYAQRNMDPDFEQAANNMRRVVDRMTGRIAMMNSRIAVDGKAELAPMINTWTNQKLTDEEVSSLMEVAPGDISSFSRLMTPAVDSADVLVRVVHNVITAAKRAASQFIDNKFFFGKKGLQKSFEDYSKWAEKKGIDPGNMEKLNEMFMHVEPNKRGVERLFLVNPNMTSEEGKAKWEALQQYGKDHPVRRYYDAMNKMHWATQNKYFKDKGRSVPYGYEIPRQRKQTYERLNAGIQAAGEIMQEQLKDTFTMREDDIDYSIKRKWNTDDDGNPVRTPPIFFNKDIPIEEVSRDIAGSIYLAARNLAEVGEMNNINGFLWMSEKVAQERQIRNDRSVVGKAFDRLAGRTDKEINKKGEHSQALKAIQMLKDVHVYKQTQKDLGSFKIPFTDVTIDGNRLNNFFRRLTSGKIMLFNFNIAFSNLMTAESMMLQEAVGKNLFSKESWARASKIVAKDGKNFVADIYSAKNRSKLSAMAQIFNMTGDIHAAHHALGERASKRGKLWNTAAQSGRAFSAFANRAVELHTMVASTVDLQVRDKDGKKKSFYDIVSVENGKATIEEGYTFNGRPVAMHGKELNVALNDITNRVVFNSESMHGIYNSIDSPLATSYLVGQHFFFMRGWLIPQMVRRFAGTRYFERRGGYSEGTYQSLAKMMIRLLKPDGNLGGSLRNLRLVFAKGEPDIDQMLSEKEKSMLSPQEKEKLAWERIRNTRKTLFELAMISSLYLLIQAAFEDEDYEEDNLAQTFRRYQTLRLYRELSFYSPREITELVKSPFILAGTARDIGDIVARSLMPMTWGETYEAGKRKGDSILASKLLRLVPVANQVRAWSDLAEQANAIEQGFR